ncbi:MAG: NUDIX domain-containing protein [Anaerolineae bacterium]
MLNRRPLKHVAAWLMRFFPHWLYNLMVRLTQTPFRVGVTAFVFDPDGRVLLLRHVFRLTYAWGPPGGWLTRGEDAAAALRRELGEETGLDVTVLIPLHVAVRGSQMEIMYLAACEGGDLRLSGEILEGGFFAPDAIPYTLRPDYDAVLRRAVAAWRAAFAMPG